MPLPLTDPRPAPPDRSIRLAFNGVYGDTNWANVMWLLLSGSDRATPAMLASIATDCGNAYADHFLSLLNVAVTLNTVVVTFFQDGHDDIGAVYTPDVTGSVDQPQLPANVSIGVSWAIAPSYRGGHPRTYLPGISSTQQGTERLLNTGVAAALHSAAIAFRDAINGGGPYGGSSDTITLGTVSFQRDREWRTPPVFYEYLGAHVDDRLDSQRRRLGADLP